MLVAALARVDRDDLAPLLAGAARHVADQHRLVVDEEGDHLLGQVDLGVVLGRLALGERAQRLDGDRVLHPLPHLVGDHAGGLVARDVCSTSFSNAHTACSGEAAELAVDRARGRSRGRQALLHLAHLVAGHAVAERLAEVRSSPPARRSTRSHDRRGGGRRDGRASTGRAPRGGVDPALLASLPPATGGTGRRPPARPPRRRRRPAGSDGSASRAVGAIGRDRTGRRRRVRGARTDVTGCRPAPA